MASVHKKDPADQAAEQCFDAEQKHYRKGENLLIAVSFVVFLLLFLILFFALPKKGYSKTENKELSSFPALSAESLFGKRFFKTADSAADGKSGRFTAGVEDYIEDHFPFKEQFVEGYALSQLASGRGGSGGVFLGKDGYLLKEETFLSDDQKSTLANYETLISDFARKLPTVAAIVPTGSQLMTNKLPAGCTAEVIESNRREVLAAFSGDKPYTFLDLYPLLAEHREEEIYFRTDHHWTPLGAFYGIGAVNEALGLPAPQIGGYTREKAADDFRGTLYNRSGMYWLPGETLEFFRFDGDEGYTVSTLSQTGKETKKLQGFYDRSALLAAHRGTSYDAFVTQVGPMVTVKDGSGKKPRLLVLKDSYAHCALPFLAQNYDLYVLEVRPKSGHLAYANKLIKDGAVDAILVLVSTDTLFG